jgi:capsule polysaccharide export protein KpsE/RkpR
MAESAEKEAFSAYCRAKVRLDAKEVADLAKVPRRTFYDWWETRRPAVELMIDGIKYRQKFKVESADKEAFSAYCRAKVGFDAAEVADLAKVPRRTFYDWWETRRPAVELMLDGIKYRQKNE